MSGAASASSSATWGKGSRSCSITRSNWPWTSAGDSCYWVFLVSGVGFLFQKPLSPKHRSTLLPVQLAATLIFSVDWGLVFGIGCCTNSP